MRTDQRYTRVRDMLTAPEVPRTEGGKGIALCHYCQRKIYFVGGFLKLLARDLEWLARYRRDEP
jgi:hypothetical protein